MKIVGIAAVTAVGMMLCGSLPATAEDAAGGTDKVLFENERVRVVEVNYPPGVAHDMHSHPDHVVYALEDAKVRFTGEDGKTTEMEIKKGGTGWQPAVTHKSENIGTTPLRVVVVELKESAK